MIDRLRHESDKIFTISNCVSFLRILLIIPTVYYFFRGELMVTAALMLFAYLTDIIDGYIARHQNTVTEFGKAIDPIADKLYVAALVIVMVMKDMVPLWFVLIVLGKDILTVIGAILIRKRIDAVPPSNYWGKAAILSTIVFLFLSVRGVTNDVLVFGWILSAILLVVSFGIYSLRAWRIISSR